MLHFASSLPKVILSGWYSAADVFEHCKLEFWFGALTANSREKVATVVTDQNIIMCLAVDRIIPPSKIFSSDGTVIKNRQEQLSWKWENLSCPLNSGLMHGFCVAEPQVSLLESGCMPWKYHFFNVNEMKMITSYFQLPLYPVVRCGSSLLCVYLYCSYKSSSQ